MHRSDYFVLSFSPTGSRRRREPTNFSRCGLNIQIARTPIAFATSTAMPQFSGFTLPSRHCSFSSFQRGQSWQYTSDLWVRTE